MSTELRAVKLVSIIEVAHTRGLGTSESPVRIVTEYFAQNGDFLAEKDSFSEPQRQLECAHKDILRITEKYGELANKKLEGDARNALLSAENRALRELVPFARFAAQHGAGIKGGALVRLRKILQRLEKDS